MHEVTFALLPDEESETFEQSSALIRAPQGYRALLIGPGLGQSALIREVMLQVLEHLRSQPDSQRPRLLVDADGLNNLSALERWWTLLPPGRDYSPSGRNGRLCGGLKVSGRRD